MLTNTHGEIDDHAGRAEVGGEYYGLQAMYSSTAVKSGGSVHTPQLDQHCQKEGVRTPELP